MLQHSWQDQEIECSGWGSAEGSGCQLSILTSFSSFDKHFITWDWWLLKILHCECKVSVKSINGVVEHVQSFYIALQFYFRDLETVSVWGSSICCASSPQISFVCHTAFISSGLILPVSAKKLKTYFARPRSLHSLPLVFSLLQECNISFHLMAFRPWEYNSLGYYNAHQTCS